MASRPRASSRKKIERDELKQTLRQVQDKSELRPTYLRLKERQRLEREQLILEAADQLFLEKGYHDTSIDDIAAQVGISKGTVYLHFASKEDLIFALLERGMRQLQATLDEILSSPGTPRERLNAVIRQMSSSMMNQQRLQLMQSIFQSPELHTRLMERREVFTAMWGDPQQRITALFEEGKAAGEFDTETPTPIMLSLFWSMLSPQHFRMLILEKQMSSDLVVVHLSRCFFKGIAPSGEDPAVSTESTSEGSTPA